MQAGVVAVEAHPGTVSNISKLERASSAPRADPGPKEGQIETRLSKPGDLCRYVYGGVQ